MSPEKTAINYPRTMSIILKDDFDEMISNPTDETIDNVYELRSISHHMGSYRGGHYWAYGKRGQKWYDFNDTFCEEISNPFEKNHHILSFINFWRIIMIQILKLIKKKPLFLYLIKDLLVLLQLQKNRI